MKEKKPFTVKKAVITYVICFVLAAALLVGNVYANMYENLITVFLSSSDYAASEDNLQLCTDVEAEGIVLLKNDGNALPLSESEKKIVLLGQDSVDFVYGGAGSGSVDANKMPTLKTSLEDAGFTVNNTVWDFYTTGAGKDYRKTFPDVSGQGVFAVNEVPVNKFTDSVKASMDGDDAAVVVVGRGGGESSDLPTGLMDTGYRYLQLDENELDTIKLACEKFDKVVLVINSANAMELGFLDEPEYANVKAALWVGTVGQTGIYAIGQVLAGSVNPSGRLVDTYAYDSQSAPSFVNFGDYDIVNSQVDRGNKYLVYAEGIYVGYRYYETRYEDAVLGQGNAGDYDYAATVQFPFGHGLSYTEFQWTNYSMTENGDAFDITVTVKNTGVYAGKDVVEIYMQSPYTDYDRENAIEKSAVELVGFAKTGVIEVGAEESVTVSVPKELTKTYDSKNAKTYIVDAGTYYFAAGRDAHDALNNILAVKKADTSKMTAGGDSTLVAAYEQATLDSSTYAVSLATGTAITNQFENADINNYGGGLTYLTRSDWGRTFPTVFADGKWTAPGEFISELEFYTGSGVLDGVSSMPSFESTATKLTVSDLKDADYDDPRWMDLVSQLSVSDATRLVRLGGYSTIGIESIGLPTTQDKDGPSGISGTLVGGTSCMAWPAEVVFASTWNVDLIERVGEAIGDDSIQAEVAGWYAPGVNIHRSPYSGRNFEYFSEDGLLSGMIGAAEMRGVRTKGVIAYMKHFALNDQETNRYGGAIFANEQAIREVFLKGFEYTARNSDAVAAMASMNRMGPRWTGAHAGLIRATLREEWGFQGMVITDQASVESMFYQDMISGLWAGTDLWLNTNTRFWSLKDYQSNATVMTNVQSAAKNIIYAVAKSNAMGVSGTMTTDGTPLWRIGLIALDVVVFGACAAGVVITTIKLVKRKKA